MTPSPEIQIGTVVRLKSGGPKMTASHLHSGCQWHCQWFDREDTLRGGSFPMSALMVVEVK